MIWNLTAQPRTVHVYEDTDDAGEDCVWTPTSVPAVMQVCRESRRFGPYSKAFVCATGTRYIWINFTFDMIAIEDDDLLSPVLDGHEQDIQRLEFDGSDGTEYFCQHGHEELKRYLALREINVIVSENVHEWAKPFNNYTWGSCPRNNIRFYEDSSGEWRTGQQVSDLQLACESGSDEEDDYEEYSE